MVVLIYASHSVCGQKALVVGGWVGGWVGGGGGVLLDYNVCVRT